MPIKLNKKHYEANLVADCLLSMGYQISNFGNIQRPKFRTSYKMSQKFLRVESLKNEKSYTTDKSIPVHSFENKFMSAL